MFIKLTRVHTVGDYDGPKEYHQRPMVVAALQITAIQGIWWDQDTGNPSNSIIDLGEERFQVAESFEAIVDALGHLVTHVPTEGNAS